MSSRRRVSCGDSARPSASAHARRARAAPLPRPVAARSRSGSRSTTPVPSIRSTATTASSPGSIDASRRVVATAVVTGRLMRRHRSAAGTSARRTVMPGIRRGWLSGRQVTSTSSSAPTRGTPTGPLRYVPSRRRPAAGGTRPRRAARASRARLNGRSSHGRAGATDAIPAAAGSTARPAPRGCRGRAPFSGPREPPQSAPENPAGSTSSGVAVVHSPLTVRMSTSSGRRRVPRRTVECPISPSRRERRRRRCGGAGRCGP